MIIVVSSVGACVTAMHRILCGGSMISTEDIRSVTNGHVYGSNGEKIGSVGQVYLDNHSGQPAWVTVKTGLFGTKASFVPLAEASVDGNDLRVPYDKNMIKDAPNVDAEGELTPEEEDELYRYYGVPDGGSPEGQQTQSQQEQGRQAEGGLGGPGRQASAERPETEQRSAAGGPVAGGLAGGLAGGAVGRAAEHREHEGQSEHGGGEHREGDRGGHGEHRGLGEHEGAGEGGERRDHAADSEREHRGGQQSEAGEARAGRRIRRYIVTEETITRREEVPTDKPLDTGGDQSGTSGR